MKLLYVRHGKTEGNLARKYIGRTESPLTAEGIAGAERVAEQLIESGEHIDGMYCSSLGRQIDTAKIIASKIGYPAEAIIVNDLLLERAGGKYEGEPLESFFALSEEEQIAGGAESFKDLAARAVAMVNVAEDAYPEGTVLFVGSAAIGEMMRAMIKYGDHTRMFDDGPLPNSEIVQLI